MYRLPNTELLENNNRFVTSKILHFNMLKRNQCIPIYSWDPLLLVLSAKMYNHIWIHIKQEKVIIIYMETNTPSMLPYKLETCRVSQELVQLYCVHSLVHIIYTCNYHKVLISFLWPLLGLFYSSRLLQLYVPYCLIQAPKMDIKYRIQNTVLQQPII